MFHQGNSIFMVQILCFSRAFFSSPILAILVNFGLFSFSQILSFMSFVWRAPVFFTAERAIAPKLACLVRLGLPFLGAALALGNSGSFF
jgi:hypothetical protein